MKICGITKVEDARCVEQAGADAIGFVLFSNSPRSVSVREAREIMAALGPYITTVCVSETQSKDELKEILSLNPSAIQLYHDVVFPRRPDVKLIRALGRDELMEYECDAILLDESRGTGRLSDYRYARHLAATQFLPLILSGGLTPDNVGKAIRRVRPYAVDVSSGVEMCPGIKDPEKIRAFVTACREAMV